MAGILVRGETQTQREDQVTIKIGVICLQAKECHGLPAMREVKKKKKSTEQIVS